MATGGYVKYNQPRQLKQTEQLQDLNHWVDAYKTYYLRDHQSKHFLKPGVTWDPQHATYEINPQETGDNKRSAAELHQDLLLFLSNLAGYLPFDYVSEQIKTESTCLQDCWDLIYEIYEVKVGTDTFLSYSTIKRDTGETYRCLYERMCGQVRQHLPKKEVVIKGVKVGAGGERMTVMLYNLIALNWLDKINPSLKQIIRKEFANQFADEKQLCELVPVIAPQIDGMLARHEIKSITVNEINAENTEVRRVQEERFDPDEYEADVEEQIRQIKNFKRRGDGRGRGRERESRDGGRGFRRDGNSYGRGGDRRSGRSEERKFCHHCQLLKTTVKSEKSQYIDVNHDPRNCNKRYYAVRLTEAIDEIETELSGDEGNIRKMNSQEPILNLQKTDGEEEHAEKPILKPILSMKKVRLKTDFNKEKLSDLSEDQIQEFQSSIESIRQVISKHSVPKADSPSLFGEIRGKGTETIFDEGAQLNVLDDKFARELNLKIIETPQMASAANKTPMKVTGQTKEDLVVKFNAGTEVVEINLGKVVTVENLGTKILVGEPGKRDNRVVTVPHEHKIEFRGGEKVVSMPYYRKKKGRKDYKVARVQQTTTLYPGEAINIKLDDEMRDRDLAVTPRGGVDWLEARVRRVTGDTVELFNSTEEVVHLRKGDQVADIRTCGLSQDTPYIRRIHERMSDNFMYTDFSTVKDDPDANLKLLQIDPDNILTEEERRSFWEVSEHYKHLFTPRPGKYNGFYGDISNRLNFASVPAQNTRVYTPNYTPEMKDILAKKLDDLMDWGVLVRPEEYNISVEKISPSLVVPKSEPGQYRVVTDFTGVNVHIKKVPSLTPTIAEAKQAMAKSKYVIMMDLSNYFYQSGVVAEDAQYLGTMHPFKGVLVYSCQAQGVKGASEYSYEKIERIYGDMVQAGRLATMADGLYPKGNSVQEALENYAEVLRRADLCGLTFKPSKTIICPVKTELFGWELDAGRWRPTVHTRTTLASHEKPKTSRQMRSYLGAWKQLSSCINNYAVLLHPLEMMIAGKAPKEYLVWTEETEKAFEDSKEAAGKVDGVYEARPTDIIHTYSDFSQRHGAIGGKMMLHRKDEKTGETKIILGGHFSATLDKHKKKWLACEGEAAGIRLTLMHFAPQIRSSVHDAVHHTDSKPCVQAWGRSKKGAYSASSRLATFLTDLSNLSVELVYTPGKEMWTSDFASRHPPICKSDRCQVCKFVEEWEILGDNAANIKAISVEEIQQGKSIMPFTQERVLRDIQHNDSMHNKLRELIKLGHLPDKRKTGGENTKLKLLHNLYKEGKMKVDKDGTIKVKTDEGHYNGYVISLPAAIFRGYTNALHVRLNHPSRHQLGSLMKRYFYTVGSVEIIAEVHNNCQQCASMKVLPKVLTEDTTSKPESFGSNFAADVIEQSSQNLFIIRESLSQFTQGIIIRDQKADTLEEAILGTVLELIPDQGTTIRVDGAKAFQSLDINSKKEDSYLAKYNIKLDIGRTLNRNKNPQAENANKEVEKEILRIWPEGRALTNIELAMVMKNINSRIRYHGYAPTEIMLRRDLVSHKEKNIQDMKIRDEQTQNRETNSLHQEKFLEKSRKKTPPQKFSVGQLVFVRSQLTKTKARELYIVEERLETDPVTYTIRKAMGKLRRTTYTALEDELIKAPGDTADYEADTERTTASEETTASEGELIVGPSSDSKTEEENEEEGELAVGPSVDNTKESESSEITTSSSNDYDTNYRGRPRRQAAQRASRAWNRAVFKTKKKSDAVAIHGSVQDDDDFNFSYEMEQYLVPRLENMALGEADIIEEEIDMDIDSSINTSRDQNNVVAEHQDNNVAENQDQSEIREAASSLEARNADKNTEARTDSADRSKGAISKKRNEITIEKIIPATPHSRGRVELKTTNSSSANHRAASLSKETGEEGRINPHRVGEFGDILDRIQRRSSSRPEAKKPEGHYRHLNSRGHQ